SVMRHTIALGRNTDLTTVNTAVIEFHCHIASGGRTVPIMALSSDLTGCVVAAAAEVVAVGLLAFVFFADCFFFCCCALTKLLPSKNESVQRCNNSNAEQIIVGCNGGVGSADGEEHVRRN